MSLCGFSSALVLLCLLSAISASNSYPTYIQDDISINCGSTGTFAAVNSRNWVGDERPKFSLEGISTSSNALKNLIPGDKSVIYATARISHSMFSYSFHVNPGQKMICFHFNPSPYKSFKNSKDFFNVEAGPFTLMSNFSASLTAQALGVDTFIKVFYMRIEENKNVNIVFSPSSSPSQEKRYAFVNGIEIVSVPSHLSYFRGGEPRTQVVGRKSSFYVDNNTALEIVHRLNVNCESGDAFDEYGSHAPSLKQKENELSNQICKRLVDVGFRYLVRVHFCGLGLEAADIGHVKISINEIVVDTNADIIKEMDEKGNIGYIDYLVVMMGRKQDDQRGISIRCDSDNDFIDRHKLLKGFEILKLSNPDNSLASPNPLPPERPSTSWTIHLPLSNYNFSTPAVITIALVSIILYLCHFFDVIIPEEQNRPSAKAERHCRRFTLAEMQSATRNFSDAFVIGRGGFGKVYKGLINNGKDTVAVKRLKLFSQQGKNEFLTEIETLSELRHVNLVSLIGYCNECGEMILVYEYMSSGTLADQIYKLSRHDNSFLTWKQRLNICIGAGRGLEYLHTGNGVIHRDIKASNILLDENFVAKVADFGLAKLIDRRKLQSYVSTKVKGTPGYLDPHYRKTSKLTSKSDTYAFGVVLFQVLCGRPAVDRTIGENECFLTDWARNRIEMGEIDQIVASSLREEISAESLKVFVDIAEKCLCNEPKKRPTMSQVVVQLELALEQHEKGNVIIPNQDIIVVDEICSSRNKANKIVYGDPSATNRDRAKLKVNKPLRLWTLDELWNMVKTPKKKDLAITSLSEICEAEINLSKFELATLAAATNQFSSSNKIEEGPHGSVYKAVLPLGQIVAVKWLSPSALQCLDELKTEILILSNLRHHNIIKLLGYCFNGEESMLVYEFMANRSLDSYIFDEVERPLLHWALRFKIIMGIARGIMHMHRNSGKRIIHQDIKPGNVLLNIQMDPKIANFNFAILLAGDKLEMQIDKIVGTAGYLSPELIHSGKASLMSDVYSFGILILETLSGKETNLTYAWKLWNEGKALDLVDESIKGSFWEEEALRCIQVGLLCKKESHHRPTMSRVVEMLAGGVLHERVLETLPSLNMGTSCCKLNTGAKFFSDTGYSSGGGLLRDDHGTWIMGFSCKFGECSLIEAGLLALREGLKLAFERRIQNIQVQINKRYIVILEESNTNADPLGAIIYECRALMKLLKVNYLLPTYRGSNKCAGALAKIGHQIDVLKLVWEFPPKELIHLLKNDEAYIDGNETRPWK